MTAPWTPRERRLREALEKAKESHALFAKLTGTADSTTYNILSAALTDPPPPDPRDEALRLAEEFIAGVKLDNDIDIQKIDEILTAIAVAKGEQ